MRFRDRADAGRQLAGRLRMAQLDTPIILALPRGGVPVAAEIAKFFDAPLDVFVARKIGMPGHEEFGIGAVAEGLDEPILSESGRLLHLKPQRLRDLAERQRDELQRRVNLYRGGRPLPNLVDRDVVLVDDGLATGVTAEAALRALRKLQPRRIVLAVPVCSRDTAERFAGVADEVVCLETPDPFFAVGQVYDNFRQLTDEEVIEMLR